MFLGKKQTGFMNQPPAVNMPNQPFEGFAPELTAPEGMYQAQMGQMGQMEQMGQMSQMDQMGQMGQMGYMGQMDHMGHMDQMGYTCDPCGYCCPCPEQPPETPQMPQVYVVQKGDSVYKIAQKFGLDWRELAGFNHLGNPDLIYPGERLFIPPRY